MSENKQGETPVKVKRRSLYYILLSACALVVAAAITLTVVFFPQPGDSQLDNNDPPIENPDDNDDDKDDDDDDEDPGEPGGTEIVFSLPVSGATVSTATSCCFSRMRWPRICAGNISLSATASVQNDVRWISFANSSSGGSTAG